MDDSSPELTRVSVAVPLPVPRAFTYGVPEGLAREASTGKRVLVPFKNRRLTGYILGPADHDAGKEIKMILDVLDDAPLFDAGMIPFFEWIAAYYMHPLGEVIRTALPGGINISDVSVYALSEEGRAALAAGSGTPVEARVLQALSEKEARYRELAGTATPELPRALLYAMVRRGWLVRKNHLTSARTGVKMQRHVRALDAGAPSGRLSEKGARLLTIIREAGETAVHELKQADPSAPRLIRTLEKNGHVAIFEKCAYRDPFGEPIPPDIPPELTAEQQTVYDRITGLTGKGFAACLLAGVTGSGKTEIYMRIAADALARGDTVLALVPEIALISQMERRFRARFGECVAVLHSRLSAGERYDQWLRIINNEATVVIGARSAIFAPLSQLGVIIADEEHDASYKQESGLRYNARDLAAVRAKLLNIPVILGSATPSVQTCYNAAAGKFIQLTLTRRVQNRSLPEIHVADLRETAKAKGVGQFISPALKAAMKESLARGEQVLLFLNRRGFAGFPVCNVCGGTIHCKRCDIALTYHKHANALRCHYCGFSRPALSHCPNCDAAGIRFLGLGTEKVEAAVKALFPAARVVRMDRDTTARKGALLTILKRLKNREIDILVGTQMVAKGHDFPHITLVGVICADLGMSLPDFRSGEKTFQILAQVAGRAGRGDAPGRVVLQTYNPDHFTVRAARDQDYAAFYEREIGFRKELDYPPFSRMVQLKISGKDPAATRDVALKLRAALANVQKMNAAFSSVQVLGPAEAPLARIAGRHRWQALLKGKSAGVLKKFLYRLRADYPALMNNKHVSVAIDVDPVSML